MARRILVLLCLFEAITLKGVCQPEQLVVNLPASFKSGHLIFENPKGSVKVTGYDGNVILITGTPRYSSKAEEDNAGMHRIGMNELDISAEVNGSNILVLCRTTGKTVDFDIKLPRDFSLKLKSLDNGDVEVINVNGEIEAEDNYGDIKLDNIAGSAVLSSVSGDITAVFRKVTAGSPMMFTTFEGSISITLPDDVQALFKMKSETGEIMSDFNIVPAKRQSIVKDVDNKQVWSLEDWMTGTVNGGGPEYIMRTYSGKVSIKKR